MGLLLGSEEPVGILVSHRKSDIGRKLVRSLEAKLTIPARLSRATGQTRANLNRLKPDVVLVGLDGDDDLAVIRSLTSFVPRPSIIALAGPGRKSLHQPAIRAGADDLIDLPASGEVITECVEMAISLAKPEPAVETAFDTLDSCTAADRLANRLGSSRDMLEAYRQIDRIAASDAPVVISGRPGVGKAESARALHDLSSRPDGPFITIHCSTYEGRELETELFGVDNPTTGGHRGAFEEAASGTLFLDEIDALSRGTQARLLRFLQNSKIYREGSTTGQEIDVRLICACDEDPNRLVESNRLRPDLFYRLNVLPIKLKPLCERPNDIVTLANTFLHLFTEQEEKTFKGINPDAEQAMLEYDWPGNAGQLQNVIRRIVVMHEGPKITYDMLSTVLSETGGSNAIRLTDPAPKCQAQAGTPMVEPFWLQERRIIEDAVNACHGNISQAAAALEISPSTIYRKRLAWAQSLSN